MATKKKRKEATALTRCSGTMTESEYLGWIRSCLRAKSLRWKPRTDCIDAAKRPYNGPNKRQKWEVLCSICEQYFTLKEIVVDHYPHEAGSILSIEDVGPFAERLFCEVDNLRCLCRLCHRKHTLASAQDITLEEAECEIWINDMLKNKEATKKLLTQYNLVCKNDAQRKEALKQIYQTVKEK